MSTKTFPEFASITNAVTPPPRRGSTSSSWTKFVTIAESISAATVAGCRIPICAGAGGTMSTVSAVEIDEIPMPPMSNASASRLRRIMKSLLE